LSHVKPMKEGSSVEELLAKHLLDINRLLLLRQGKGLPHTSLNLTRLQ
jgi:hypothetical protein